MEETQDQFPQKEQDSEATQSQADTVPGAEPEFEFGGSAYDSSKNPFLTRGCCNSPEPHQKQAPDWDI